MANVQELLAGRYRLLDVLGRGGMGVVYRATDHVLERQVAIKVLPIEHAEDPALVARFEREALAAAALNHRNIVAVYDSGRDGDTRFIAMECVSGENLAQLVRRRGSLPAEEAVEITAQVAGALAAAHQAGIVHRDVKPANVMVDQTGTVKVLDFGIARAAASTALTRTANVLGSAPYLAPELALGKAADPRSDIYSLGCVLYELLTGRPAFAGDIPAAIMHQHAAVDPRPARELNPSIPPGLDRLVTGMLAKQPGDRPQRAAEIVEALTGGALESGVRDEPFGPTAATAQLGHAGAGATASTRLLRQTRPWGRLQALVLGVAAVIVVAGLAVALAGGFSSSPRHSPTGFRSRRPPARTGQTSATVPARTPTARVTAPTPAVPAPGAKPGRKGKGHGHGAKGAPGHGHHGPPGGPAK